MKNFESRFAAQAAKFNPISNTTKLPEFITALMLLSNSGCDDSQRVTVLAAASPSNSNLTPQSTNDEFLKAVTYPSVASVIKQCDKSSHDGTENSPLAASSAGTSCYRGPHRGNKERSNHRTHPTRKYPCNLCGKYGHCKSSHNEDGSLPSNVPSYDSPTESNQSHSRSEKNGSSSNTNHEKSHNWKKKAVSFNKATLTTFSSSTKNCSVELGPLVDSGAPYAAIGLFELNLLADHVGIRSNPKLDAIPNSLKGHTHMQYGDGEHASVPRRILGSIVLTARSDE